METFFYRKVRAQKITKHRDTLGAAWPRQQQQQQQRHFGTQIPQKRAYYICCAYTTKSAPGNRAKTQAGLQTAQQRSSIIPDLCCCCYVTSASADADTESSRGNNNTEATQQQQQLQHSRQLWQLRRLSDHRKRICTERGKKETYWLEPIQ